jgi:hypothetical protein
MPGATRCMNTTEQNCNVSGKWESQPIVRGTCGAQCTPGESLPCADTAAQSCDNNGKIVKAPVIQNICGAECTPPLPVNPGCDGTVPLVCNGDGRIGRGPIIGGICGADCTPGNAGCEQGTTKCWGLLCGKNATGTELLNMYACSPQGKAMLTGACGPKACPDGTQLPATCSSGLLGNAASCGNSGTCPAPPMTTP